MLLSLSISNYTVYPALIHKVLDRLLQGKNPMEEIQIERVPAGGVIKPWQTWSSLVHIEPTVPKNIFQVPVSYDFTALIEHPIYEELRFLFHTVTSFTEYLFFQEFSLPIEIKFFDGTARVSGSFAELPSFLHRVSNLGPLVLDRSRGRSKAVLFTTAINPAKAESLVPGEIPTEDEWRGMFDTNILDPHKELPEFSYQMTEEPRLSFNCVIPASTWESYIPAFEESDVGFGTMAIMFFYTAPLLVPETGRPLIPLLYTAMVPMLENPESEEEEVLDSLYSYVPIQTRKGLFPKFQVANNSGNFFVTFISHEPNKNCIVKDITVSPSGVRVSHPRVPKVLSGSLEDPIWRRVFDIGIEVDETTPLGPYRIQLTYETDGTQYLDDATVDVRGNTPTLGRLGYQYILEPPAKLFSDGLLLKHYYTPRDTVSILLEVRNNNPVDSTGIVAIPPSAELTSPELITDSSDNRVKILRVKEGFLFRLPPFSSTTVRIIFKAGEVIFIKCDGKLITRFTPLPEKLSEKFRVLSPFPSDILYRWGRPGVPITVSLGESGPLPPIKDIKVYGEVDQFFIERREYAIGVIRPSFLFEEPGTYDVTLHFETLWDQTVPDVTIHFTIDEELFLPEIDLFDGNFYVRDEKFHVSLLKMEPKIVSVPIVNKSPQSITLTTLRIQTPDKLTISLESPDLFPIELPPGGFLWIPLRIISYEYGRQLGYLYIESESGFSTTIPIATFTNAGPQNVYVYPIHRDLKIRGIVGSLAMEMIPVINFGDDECIFRSELLGYDRKEFWIPERGTIPPVSVYKIPVAFTPTSLGKQIAYAHIRFDSMINYFYYGDLESAEVKIQQARLLKRIDAYSIPQEAAPRFIRELIDFGFVRPGQKKSETIDIKNLGVNPFTIVSINISRPELASLPKMDLPIKVSDAISIPITVTAPDEEGDHTAVVTFEIHDAITKNVMVFNIPVLVRVSTSDRLYVRINSKEIEFGYSEINHPKGEEVIIRNLSNKTIQVQVREIDDTEGVFNYPQLTVFLAPDKEFTLPIVFVPHRIGDFFGTLRISLDDQDFFIDLHGQGVDYESPLILEGYLGLKDVLR